MIIDLKIDDKGALVSASLALGLVYKHGQRRYRGYDRDDDGNCNDAICVPNNRNAHEIGVIYNHDDTLSLAWDDYDGGRGLVDIVGAGAEKLKDEYAAQVATKQYEQDGYSVTRSYDAENGIVLTAMR